MIAAAEPVKSTSCLPYGMAMTKIFRYYGVPLKGEGFTEDWTFFGLKNINQLKLDPFLARQFAMEEEQEEEEEQPSPIHSSKIERISFWPFKKKE